MKNTSSYMKTSSNKSNQNNKNRQSEQIICQQNTIYNYNFESSQDQKLQKRQISGKISEASRVGSGISKRGSSQNQSIFYQNTSSSLSQSDSSVLSKIISIKQFNFKNPNGEESKEISSESVACMNKKVSITELNWSNPNIEQSQSLSDSLIGFEGRRIPITEFNWLNPNATVEEEFSDGDDSSCSSKQKSPPIKKISIREYDFTNPNTSSNKESQLVLKKDRLTIESQLSSNQSNSYKSQAISARPSSRSKYQKSMEVILKKNTFILNQRNHSSSSVSSKSSKSSASDRMATFIKTKMAKVKSSKKQKESKERSSNQLSAFDQLNIQKKIVTRTVFEKSISEKNSEIKTVKSLYAPKISEVQINIRK